MKKNCEKLLLGYPISTVIRSLPYVYQHTIPNVETYSILADIDLAQNRLYQLPQFARMVASTFRLRQKKVPVTFLYSGTGDF